MVPVAVSSEKVYRWLEKILCVSDDAEEEQKKKEEERERKRKAQETSYKNRDDFCKGKQAKSRQSALSFLICWKTEKKRRNRIDAYKAFKKDLSCLGYRYSGNEWNYPERAV